MNPDLAPDGTRLAIVSWAGPLWIVNRGGRHPVFRASHLDQRVLAVAWER